MTSLAPTLVCLRFGLEFFTPDCPCASVGQGSAKHSKHLVDPNDHGLSVPMSFEAWRAPRQPLCRLVHLNKSLSVTVPLVLAGAVDTDASQSVAGRLVLFFTLRADTGALWLRAATACRRLSLLAHTCRHVSRHPSQSPPHVCTPHGTI